MTNAEIKIGEYVRTNNGDIFKVANFYQKGNIYTMVDERGVLFGNPRKVAKKHSFNIIDLIEVCDYVNGLPVRFVENGRIDIGQEESYLWLKNEHIVSVVTHEQFEAMEYEVGGEDDR